MEKIRKNCIDLGDGAWNTHSTYKLVFHLIYLVKTGVFHSVLVYFSKFYLSSSMAQYTWPYYFKSKLHCKECKGNLTKKQNGSLLEQDW